MEDAHSIHLHLPPSTSASSSSKSNTDTDNDSFTNPSEIPVQPAGSTVTNDAIGEDGNALFGVFDGHGGSAVAKFAGTTMHTRLTALESYSEFNLVVQVV
jgi:protein phosphatase 2C family protein 2/3